MTSFLRARRLALLSGAVLLATAVRAQDSTPAPEADQGVGVQTTRTESGAIIVTAHRYVPAGVVTANKTNIPLVETPQSISVITRDQIDLLNFTDLQQAVRYTSGAFGENYGSDPRYDFVTVRGFTPKQYIDGLAAPATTTIPFIGLDLYAFDALDVLKGPSSVLYGAAPPGGIINEESRRASSTAGGEIEAKYGTRNYAELAGTFTGAATDFLNARFTGLYRNSDGDQDHSNSKRLMVAPTATLKLGDSTRLTGLAYYQYDLVRGGAGGFLPVYGTLLDNPNPDLPKHISRSTNLDDPRDKFERRQYGVGYNFEHDFSNWLKFVSNSKWSHYREETPTGLYEAGGYVNTTDPTQANYYRDVSRSNFSYAETVSSFATDNRLDAKVATGAVTQKLLAGIDYRRVQNLSFFNFVGVPGVLNAYDPVYDEANAKDVGFPFAFGNQRLKQLGAYGQDQISIGNLRILLGGRYDWVRIYSPSTTLSEKQHKFTYRIGASYVTPSGVAPYISYSTSFEPVLGFTADGKPFKPSSVKQWEGGVKYDGRTLPGGIKVFATAAVFDIKETNFVSPVVTIGPAFGTQAGEVEVYGGELELVARINDQLSINGSYSYTHSEITKTSLATTVDKGAPMPTTPRHKLSLFADYTLQKGTLAGLGMGFGGRYNSKSAGSLPSNSSVDPFTGVPTVYYGPATTLFDAIVHYDLPHWRIAVNGSNIFDKRYVARCAALYQCFYGAGRQVLGTVTYKF
ncbi:TonB-dependent siderophore receptor [Nostoc sp. 3335mG]|nr:TonB-dependent siderophore receptor [Nostoc sp. 3335mG]